MSIRVRVRLFAIQRELAGTREVPLELADDADVEDAWVALVERHPVLGPGRASLRFARNGDYADPTTMLADGDEVAMIPPVSGGSGTRADGTANPARILELREAPFTTAILVELADALAVPEDGAVVGSEFSETANSVQIVARLGHLRLFAEGSEGPWVSRTLP